jgi:AraC-like DNA-binding protein
MKNSNKHHTTLTSIAVAVVRAAQSYSVDIDPFMVQTGLNPDAIKNPNARYPDMGLNRFIELATDASGDPCFGIHAGDYLAPTSLHALGFSLLASETLLAALQRLVRYFRIVSDATEFEIGKNKSDYSFSLRFLQWVPPARIDLSLVLLLDLYRRLQGLDIVKARLRLGSTQIIQRAALQARFAEIITIEEVPDSDVIELVLEKNAVERILPTGNAELAYQNDKIIADYLARFDSERLSERVRAIFMDRMVTGKFTEDQIAEQLDISLRSLQRRLREERTSYQQLLDETRLELALQYINRTQLSVAQISPLLGFSNSSNFNRAFKRWLGLPPSRYRAAGLY